MPQIPPVTVLIDAVVAQLRERRAAGNVSKKSLAASAGVTRTAILLMERGDRRPSLELVLRISAGLGVPASEVLRAAEKAAPRPRTGRKPLASD